MSYGRVFLILGWLVSGVALAMLVPLAGALLGGQLRLAGGFLASFGLTAFAGLAGAFAFRGAPQATGPREAVLLAVLTWGVVPLFGMLPWLTSGLGLPLLDLYFDAVSAFTTTGAVVVPSAELPGALLLWRCLLAWLGGLTSLIAAVSLVALAVGEAVPLRSVPMSASAGASALASLGSVARTIAPLYGGLTALSFLGLVLSGADPAQALCQALALMATAGFDLPLAPGATPFALDAVILITMLVGALNITRHAMAMGRPVTAYGSDRELRLLGWLVLAGTAAALLAGQGLSAAGVWTALFQTVSFVSTTGSTSLFSGSMDSYPKAVALGLAVIGGSALSTAGGLKLVRFGILMIQGRRELAVLAHPHGVMRLRSDGRVVSRVSLSALWSHFIGLLLLIAFLALALAAAGASFEAALLAAAGALSNVGPLVALTEAPSQFYSALPGWCKISLAFAMVVGRVEVLALLVLLNPSYWRP